MHIRSNEKVPSAAKQNMARISQIFVLDPFLLQELKTLPHFANSVNGMVKFPDTRSSELGNGGGGQ